jgi:glucosamine-phosphate N-acetyltransferase
MGRDIRLLQKDDVSPDSEFFPILNQLSKTTDYHNLPFEWLWDTYDNNKDMHVLVAEKYGKIIGTGSVLIEQKFLRGGGRVGHIEDVVVDNRSREKGTGRAIIDSLVEIAKEEGCYKVILNCSNENVPFYVKCGFRLTENEMRLDL